MTLKNRLSDLGKAGLRLTANPDGGLAVKSFTPIGDEIRTYLRDNRDEILALVADLDRRLAIALRTLGTLSREASHRPATLAIVAIYRETVIELRERLDPIAGELDEAARLFAARVVIPPPNRHTA